MYVRPWSTGTRPRRVTSPFTRSYLPTRWGTWSSAASCSSTTVPSTRFEDLRPTLDAAERSAAGEDGGSDWATDMQRFFDMFANRKLALDIFTVVEDGRLDGLVKVEYLGIRPTTRRPGRLHPVRPAHRVAAGPGSPRRAASPHQSGSEEGASPAPAKYASHAAGSPVSPSV